MSRNYKFHNPEGIYFVSFAVVDWVDVLTKPTYKDILVDSLAYCQKNKGLIIFCWCIMVLKVLREDDVKIVVGYALTLTVRTSHGSAVLC